MTREPAASGGQVAVEPRDHPQKSHAPTRTSLPSNPIGQDTKMSEAPPPARDVGLSQPMTASNAAPSNLAVTAVEGQASNGPSPYGTRSRNRNSNRPNYAEDREPEIEFEYQLAHKEDDSQKTSRSTTAVATNGNTTMRDPIPGTSTFSVTSTPTAPPSKKRKTMSHAAAAAAANATPAQSAVPAAHAAARRASAVGIMNQSLRVQDSNMLTFDDSKGRLRDGKLVADDGTVLAVNDHAYLICEPPGEPYYLGRIMEFLHTNNDPDKPIDALRLNWYYRPKDIGRKVNDTRQVFASMHSDVSPITALRGKCEIKHKSEVKDLDELRKTRDCFWYEKLYDRYIQRYYEVIPTSQVVNVPTKVKEVLRERWKYIIVESSRAKELTSASKSCKRCAGFCANNDSVDCAVCKQTFHMNCVRPPLLKKPSRGFAWACGPCSRAQERKLAERNTPNISADGEEEEVIDEEEEEATACTDGFGTGGSTPSTSSNLDLSTRPVTAEQIHQASLWPFRYLGVHCKVEDALDYDDRIYPRASSRLGPRHQANVTVWHGRPVELVKPADIKRKYVKGSGHKKGTKLTEETVAALEADKIYREKRPKWVVDAPPGYIARGEDYDNSDPRNTAELKFRLPEVGEMSTEPQRGGDDEVPEDSDPEMREKLIADYMARAKRLAGSIGVESCYVNFLDACVGLLFDSKFNVEEALKKVAALDKKALKEPELTTAELKKFEDGVAKYGSELYSVKKHVKTMSTADITRFYYLWKKSDRGKQIWGNFSGRKGKKEAKKAEAVVARLQDDVADDHDDSAFDNDKAARKKRGFQCKFCSTRKSRQWRRAPNTTAGATVSAESGGKGSSKKESSEKLMVALCRRCAELWRRYGIQYEDPDYVAKQLQTAGGRAWKRKVDEELLYELQAANQVSNLPPPIDTSAYAPALAQPAAIAGPPEPTKKKGKAAASALAKELADPTFGTPQAPVAAPPAKKKAPEKPPPPPPPPPVPEIPKAKALPCAICLQMEPSGDQRISCRECRMTVHRQCYGVIGEVRGKWTCDMCANDKNPQVSISYQCMLCPIEITEQDFVEPPKISHKKKTEKEREKDRIEREKAQEAADYYRKKQEEMNRPINPREPLKRTANNNWVHVTCAVWTPEVKFANAQALEVSEGIPSIPSARYDEICKACKTNKGACVQCHHCRASVHVECAHQKGYILGFDIAPVKGSRRDHVNIVNINGEVGVMSAAIWCKEHVPTKTIVHRMHDIVEAETGLTALQLFVRNFKQADLALTGTVRKATLVNLSTKVLPMSTVNRRASTISSANANGHTSRSSHNTTKEETNGDTSLEDCERPKVCVTCDVDISPKWWPYPPPKPMTNGDHSGSSEDVVMTNGDSSTGTPGGNLALAAAAVSENNHPAPEPTEFQCHKCHWKKRSKEDPPPPQPVVVAPPLEPVAPPALAVQTTISPPVVPQDTAPLPNGNPYWQHSPPYHASPYSDWNSHSPAVHSPAMHAAAVQAPPIVRPAPYTDRRSPASGPLHSYQSVPMQPNGVHNRRPSVEMLQSPRQTAPMGHNGYPPPPIRHHMQSPVLHHGQNPFGSYAPPPRPPQHLTNGGPPPRANEHPFSPNGQPQPHMGHRMFVNPQTSPPMQTGTAPPSYESARQQPNGVHPPPNAPPPPNDRRVNGGASASPSLHNLLS